MPLTPGRGKKVVAKNIAELHGGATHAKTQKKFGKKTADRQSVAIALSESRKGRATRPKRVARY